MQEQPKSGLEFLVCTGASAAALMAAGWMIWRTVSEPASYSGYELISGICLLALSLYFGYLAWNLHTCTYLLESGVLTLRQGFRTMAVDLQRIQAIHRWKSRWTWHQHMRAELGVPAVDLFPVFWMFRDHAMWVLIYEDGSGESQALAVRPSSRLLHELRLYLGERRMASGEE